MQSTDLSFRFAEVKGTKTTKGAYDRVTKFLTAMTRESGHVNYFILTKADGTYVPVVILNDKTAWMAMAAVDCGCCVTN